MICKCENVKICEIENAEISSFNGLISLQSCKGIERFVRMEKKWNLSDSKPW